MTTPDPRGYALRCVAALLGCSATIYHVDLERAARSAVAHGWSTLLLRGVYLECPEEAYPHFRRSLIVTTEGQGCVLPKAMVVTVHPDGPPVPGRKAGAWLLADGIDVAALAVEAPALIALCQARGWSVEDRELPVRGRACRVEHIGTALAAATKITMKETESR